MKHDNVTHMKIAKIDFYVYFFNANRYGDVDVGSCWNLKQQCEWDSNFKNEKYNYDFY